MIFDTYSRPNYSILYSQIMNNNNNHNIHYLLVSTNIIYNIYLLFIFLKPSLFPIRIIRIESLSGF